MTCDVLTLLVQKTIVIHTNIKRLIRNMADCGTVQKINVVESNKIKFVIAKSLKVDSHSLFTISISAHICEKS